MEYYCGWTKSCTTQDTIGNHCLLVFTGDHIIPWFLRWCNILSIHSIVDGCEIRETHGMFPKYQPYQQTLWLRSWCEMDFVHPQQPFHERLPYRSKLYGVLESGSYPKVPKFYTMRGRQPKLFGPQLVVFKQIACVWGPHINHPQLINRGVAPSKVVRFPRKPG